MQCYFALYQVRRTQKLNDTKFSDSVHSPSAYSPLGLSGHDLDRCPISPQMKHFAYGNSPAKSHRVYGPHQNLCEATDRTQGSDNTLITLCYKLLCQVTRYHTARVKFLTHRASGSAVRQFRPKHLKAPQISETHQQLDPPWPCIC